jgi:hypothetical protein
MRGILLAMVAVVAGFVAVQAADEKVPLDKLPKAIADAVKKRFPKAELVSAEKETEGTKVTFEVTIKDGETKIDVDIAEDGTLLGFETKIEIKNLPKVISDAVATKYPQGKMKSAESATKVKDGKEALEYYEVVVTNDGKDVEVEVLPDGKLKPAEKKEEKKN